MTLQFNYKHLCESRSWKQEDKSAALKYFLAHVHLLKLWQVPIQQYF